MKKFFVGCLITFLYASSAHAEITIGFSAPLSGGNAIGGEELVHGAELAIADINEKGGVNGEKLILRPVDDACDPKQAVAAANQLVSAGVKFVAGYYCSGAAIPASKVFMEEGVLLVDAAASNPKLTDEAKDLVFRVYGRDDRQSSVLSAYMIKHFPGKKIAIIQDQSVYGFGIADNVRKALNAGGVKEILFDAYTPGTRDYSALISRLKQSGTEVLFIGGYYVDAGLIVRQLREEGSAIQIVSDDALAEDAFWSVTGPAGEGVLIGYVHDPSKQPQTKAVMEAARKKGYKLESYSYFAYASIETIAEGIRRAGKADTLKVAAALRGAPVKTLVGTLGFDAKGDVIAAPYVMYRWHDGKYEEIGE